MKTRNGIKGSHRGKGPLKRQRVVPKEDSPEPDASSNNETDQDGDPDYISDEKPSTSRKKRKRIREASPHPDDLPDLECSETEPQPRTPRNRQQNRSTTKRKCQRQKQIESSDSETEPAEPDSAEDVSSPEEPQRTPSNRANNQPVKQRESTTKRKRPNQIEESSDSNTESALPDSPGDASINEESLRSPSNRANNKQVRQKRRTRKRKCQRQNQIESSDSETEAVQPDSAGDVSSPEEPQRTPSNRVNNQLPQPRTSARIRTRRNRKFHKPTRQDVFEGIAESAGRPRRPIRMKAAASFTRETHFYNRDNLTESETSSVDEYVVGKYTEEVLREEVQAEDVEEEESQEHIHRRMNLASQQRRWDAEREEDERRLEDLERRHHTTTDESSASSGDEDLQPLPQEAYRADDDGTARDPVVNAPPVAAPHLLPTVPMPVQQAPVVCPYDNEDDTMYGVEDAQVNRPTANRVNYGVGAAAIETDEELEALMLAMDDREPVDPRDMVEGRRIPARNVDQQVSEDEGSIIIVSDSEEEDPSIPAPTPDRSVQDNQVAGPSRSDIDEMLAIPSCSKDYSGPVQPFMRSSHPESHNRGQVNVSIEPVEEDIRQGDGHEMVGNQLDAPAEDRPEQAVQVLQLDHEERPGESSHGFLQVQDTSDHSSKDDGKSTQGTCDGSEDMDAVLDEGPIPMMVGDDVYKNTPVQIQASPNSSGQSDQSAPPARSGYPDHVLMEQETEGGTATERRTSTAASVSSQIPFRRQLFTTTTEDEIPTTTSLQQKENAGAVNLEQFSSQSTYMSESLESEERNLEEYGESEETDDDGTGNALEALSMEITPVRRKSFRLIVSENEEEDPAPSDEPNYSRPPVTDTDDETEDDSNEDQKSDSEYDEEGDARSRSGSEYDEDDVARRHSDPENDEDDDGRRRSKRAQLVTPQKRQYRESMERYKMSRERKK